MSWAQDLEKERNLLLAEYSKLSEMKEFLRIHKRHMPAASTALDRAIVNKDVKKGLQREWRGTFFLLGITPNQRRAYRYFKRIQIYIKSVPHQLTLSGKPVSGAEVDEKLSVFANSLAARLSTGGKIDDLVSAKKIDIDALALEIEAAVTDIQAMVALLQEISIQDQFSEKELEEQLLLFGFDGSLILRKFLLSHWKDVLKMKKDAREGAYDLFHYLLPACYRYLKIPWEKLVSTLPPLAKCLHESKVDAASFSLDLKGTLRSILMQERMTWDQLMRDIPRVLQKIDADTVPWAYANLQRSPYFKNPYEWDHLEDILCSSRISVHNLKEVESFLFSLFFIKDLKKPLQNLIAILATTSFQKGYADIEVSYDEIKSLFGVLLHIKTLDLKDKYLLRQVATMLPLGGNAPLVTIIRNEAIALQIKSNHILVELRNKIHNLPGREDLEIISAYLEFIETGNAPQFVTRCTAVGFSLSSRTVERMHENHSRLMATKPLAESLLNHLQQLWRVKPEEIDKKYSQLSELDQTRLDTEHQRIFQDLLRDLKLLESFLKKEEHRRAAAVLGNLRFDARALMEVASKELKTEFFFFELFLETIEQIVHPEVLKEINMKTWKDVENLLDLLIQKSYSLMATYNSDVAMAQGVYYLQEFKEKKDIKDLQDAIVHFDYGIEYINEKTVKEFRKIFQSRNVSEKVLEELVAPFYRSGPLFQFDQLLEMIRQASERGTLRAIIQDVPRPVTAHLRERLYAGA